MRGASLASTVMVIAVAMLFALVLASACVSHLQFMQRSSLNGAARFASDSCVAAAAAKVMSDTTWGSANPTAASVTLQLAGTEPETATLTFDAHNSARLPWSTNNGNQPTGPLTGYQGRQVAAHMYDLIASGRAGGVVAVEELLLELPAFPYALASNGPVSASGALTVQGVLPSYSGALPVPAGQLAPGSLASNSAALGNPFAIDVLGAANISGNAQAVGALHFALPNQVQVGGAIQGGAAPVPLPTLTPAVLDPLANGYNVINLTPPNAPPIVLNNSYLEGWLRAAPGANAVYTVPGNLMLDGAGLYVDGNLHVMGGIIGQGAVIVNGTTAIDQACQLDSTSQYVLVSAGDVTVNPGDTGNTRTSSFQGLMYTQGDFSANDINLLGSFVTNGAPGNTTLGNAMYLRNVGVTHVPGLTHVTVQDASYPFMYMFGPPSQLLPDLNPPPQQAAVDNTPNLPANLSGSTGYAQVGQTVTSSQWCHGRIIQRTVNGQVLYGIALPNVGLTNPSVYAGNLPFGASPTYPTLTAATNAWRANADPTTNMWTLLIVNGTDVDPFFSQVQLLLPAPKPPGPVLTINLDLDLNHFLDPASTLRQIYWGPLLPPFGPAANG